ncbi:MAG: transglutaminase family protein [Elainellaceae cyanobacterium]
MRYKITHLTTYTYDRPVRLDAHVVRLRPRTDAAQSLTQFSLEITPRPIGLSDNSDLDGHSSLKAWFNEQPTHRLTLESISVVETYRDNPFNFILEPWAASLPINYPSRLSSQLQPYWVGHFIPTPGILDPMATELGQSMWEMTQGNTINFLTELNQRIYHHSSYILRETGDPYPPSVTWQKKLGSCRDLTVLFMAVCRSVGLAARFVSGYHEGDPENPDAHLHAWAEVYLPGAGWRGYDPTYGLAVGDRYIALAAAPFPQEAAPIAGALQPGFQAQVDMSYDLTIQALEPAESILSPVQLQSL